MRLIDPLTSADTNNKPSPSTGCDCNPINVENFGHIGCTFAVRNDRPPTGAPTPLVIDRVTLPGAWRSDDLRRRWCDVSLRHDGTQLRRVYPGDMHAYAVPCCGHWSWTLQDRTGKIVSGGQADALDQMVFAADMAALTYDL